MPAMTGMTRVEPLDEDATIAGFPRRRPPTEPEQKAELTEEDAAMLIARLYREGFTGKVTILRAEAKKALYFEDGRPVFATSNLPHDRMGDLLYREGKITRDQQQRARDLVVESGRRMGEILVEMGFLKPRELLPAVRHHIEDILYSLGGIFDAAIFIFYRKVEPITLFAQFRGKRLSIGVPGSALRSLMSEVLRATDAVDAFH